jgi:hypothetical protein
VKTFHKIPISPIVYIFKKKSRNPTLPGSLTLPITSGLSPNLYKNNRIEMARRE